MDDMLRESLEGFEGLWQRVSCQEKDPDRPANAHSAEDLLLGFIHDEACAGTCSAALARTFQGDGRTALLRHAAGAKRHLRRLRAEYFIATGLSIPPAGDCRRPEGRLPALRAALLQAGDMADRYEKAAERTGDPELREAFTAFAADEHRRARELRGLLIGSF